MLRRLTVRSTDRARLAGALAVSLVVSLVGIAGTLAACAPRTSAPPPVPAPLPPLPEPRRASEGLGASEGRASAGDARALAAGFELGGVPVPVPHVAEAPAPSAEPDTFTVGVTQIRQRVPAWSSGTGIAARFVQTESGKRLTFLYVDETPPEWKARLKTWFILSKAVWDGEVVSTVVVTLKDLHAGRYTGSGARDGKAVTGCMIGAAIGTDKWEPKDASTAWSTNEDGYCEVELTEAGTESAGTEKAKATASAGRRDLEGRFKAKLVSGDGLYYTIDDGFLYIHR